MGCFCGDSGEQCGLHCVGTPEQPLLQAAQILPVALLSWYSSGMDVFGWMAAGLDNMGGNGAFWARWYVVVTVSAVGLVAPNFSIACSGTSLLCSALR